MKPDRTPPLDFSHLRSGQVYRVRRTFRDSDKGVHRVGEEWAYLTRRFSKVDGSPILVVRDPEGNRRTIHLPSPKVSGGFLAELREYLVAVTEVHEDHRLTCDCEPGRADWAEVFSSPKERVYGCFDCGMVVATQALPEGVRLIELDETARAAVREVSAQPDNVSFVSLLNVAANHRSYPANLMAGALLARRPDVQEELVEALSAQDGSSRRTAFEFAAQLQHMPEALEPPILQALRTPIATDPFGDEARWAAEALVCIASRMAGFEEKVTELRRVLREFKATDAKRSGAAALALLDDVDAKTEQRREDRQAAIAVLRKLVADVRYSEADEWLEAWVQNHPEQHELLTRVWLCEESGDGLAARRQRAARWLYEKAVDLLDEYASRVATSQGVVQGWHVRRMKRKLDGLKDFAEKARKERDTAISVLRRLAVAEEHQEAEGNVEEWVESHPEEHQLLARAWLLEEAGDGLAENDKKAARWLYEKAMNWFEEYAKEFATSEGAAKTRHVSRVRRKLGAILI